MIEIDLEGEENPTEESTEEDIDALFSSEESDGTEEEADEEENESGEPAPTQPDEEESGKENPAPETPPEKSKQSEASEEKSSDDRDQRIRELEDEKRRLRHAGKKVLEKLGVKDTDDLYLGLIEAGADMEDVPPDEYRKTVEAAVESERAKSEADALQYETLMQLDLAEVKRNYPDAASYNSVAEFPHAKRFAELRDLGLSAKEAYIASHPDAVRRNVAESVRKQNLAETKNHIHSTVPKGTKDTSVTIPKKELEEWRDLFPDCSDRELAKLYKKTKE